MDQVSALGDFYTKHVIDEPTYSVDDDIILYVLHRAAAFRITYNGRQLSASPALLEQHEKTYNIITEHDPDKGYMEAVQQLVRPFEPLMAELTPNLPVDDSLHFWLYPPWVALVASTLR